MCVSVWVCVCTSPPVCFHSLNLWTQNHIKHEMMPTNRLSVGDCLQGGSDGLDSAPSYLTCHLQWRLFINIEWHDALYNIIVVNYSRPGCSSFPFVPELRHTSVRYDLALFLSTCLQMKSEKLQLLCVSCFSWLTHTDLLLPWCCGQVRRFMLVCVPVLFSGQRLRLPQLSAPMILEEASPLVVMSV